jgi:tetraacyldisaccharide 4'-kinase
VEYVARYYRDLGRRPAILSRGYGSHDEAPALAENLPDVPHLQGADRVCLARQAEVQGCDILVLDDGFQHRRLQRDLDVVLIDATQPWGHDYLFPRGLLREDVDGLGRAGVVLLTRCDLVTEAECRRLRDQILDHAGWVPIVETAHGPVEWINGSQTAALEGAIGETVAAFCGIGNPEAFRRTLTSLDMLVREFRSFPDHHRYSPADLDELNRWAARLPVDRIVTTQKDLVKLRCDSLGGKPLWALRVALRVRNGEPILHRALSNALEVRSRNHAVPLAKEGP